MKKRIIFDFDGVLADSLSITMNNINFLSQNGFDRLPLVYTQQDMSNLFDIKLGDSLLKYGYEKSEIKNFFDLHTSLMCRDASKIPVFYNIIKILEQAKYPISIVSSSYLEYMKTILNGYSSSTLLMFDEIYGRETKGTKIDKIQKILQKYSLRKDEILYIGDTSSDILICKDMKVEMIAVGYGFHPYEFLLKFAPNYCIKDESELINLLSMLYVKAA